MVKRSLFISIMVIVSLFLLFFLGQFSTVLAQSKGEFIIYGSGEEEYVSVAVEEFTKATGIKTQYLRLSTGECFNRLRAEKDNPQASVWFMGPGDVYRVAATEGLLHPYISPSAKNIDPSLKDPDGYWTTFVLVPFGFVSNKDLLDKAGLPIPTSWYDLLDPRYKGQVVLSNPFTSGTAYTVLSSLVTLMGEDEAFDYLKKLNENILQYTQSGSAPGRMAGNGEALVGIIFISNAVEQQKQGYPLTISTPKEGVGYSQELTAIIAGAPALDDAKAFIDWILSEDGQKVMQGHFTTFIYSNPAITTDPETAYIFDNLELIDRDMVWAAEQSERLKEKFHTEIALIR
ncbi:MAG: ABC transporter substrate-binding protein [Candidatus Atribacteria bacterium]|nr:ABC transporter substrate-binding protein [Candidatus Atribacteria bacterium]